MEMLAKFSEVETLSHERLPYFWIWLIRRYLSCERETHNLYREAAIVVKLDTDSSEMGHIPDHLTVFWHHCWMLTV